MEEFCNYLFESFELLLKFGKSSFLRKQESSLFKIFWIPAYAGMTKWGYFSKLSLLFTFDSGKVVYYGVAHKEVAYEPDTHHTNPR